DGAVRRSGRFDVKIPVYPPDAADRRQIFDLYIRQLSGFEGSGAVDTEALAQESPLFTPADIRTVVQSAARRVIGSSESDGTPRLTTDDVRTYLRQHSRSIQRRAAEEWIAEARLELGVTEREKLDWLESEVRVAYA